MRETLLCAFFEGREDGAGLADGLQDVLGRGALRVCFHKLFHQESHWKFTLQIKQEDFYKLEFLIQRV